MSAEKQEYQQHLANQQAIQQQQQPAPAYGAPQAQQQWNPAAQPAAHEQLGAYHPSADGLAQRQVAQQTGGKDGYAQQQPGAQPGMVAHGPNAANPQGFPTATFCPATGGAHQPVESFGIVGIIIGIVFCPCGLIA